jgi:hypothetical protein
MKKELLFFPLLFLLAGCDPIYHLNYIVQNQSQDTILVTNLFRDTIITYTILPGKNDTVFKTDGVGYSKPVFDGQKDWMRSQLAFYVFDYADADSSRNLNLSRSQFAPNGTWNYAERNRCEGKADLIITAADLKK